MLRLEEIIINKIAQDKMQLEQGLEWFDSLKINEQRETITITKQFIEQCHPDPETIENAIDKIPLKNTMTPIILLKTQTLKDALNRIETLPDNEIRKSFISLVAVFKMADTKRRNTACRNGCHHEWHNLDELDRI